MPFVLELRDSGLSVFLLRTVEDAPVVLQTSLHLVVNVDLAVQLRYHDTHRLPANATFLVV